MQAFILCTTPWLSTAPGSLFISILPQGSFLSQRRFRGSLRDKSALQSIPLVGETIFRKLFSPYFKKKKRKQLSLVTVFGISLYLTHVPCYGKRQSPLKAYSPLRHAQRSGETGAKNWASELSSLLAGSLGAAFPSDPAMYPCTIRLYHYMERQQGAEI